MAFVIEAVLEKLNIRPFIYFIKISTVENFFFYLKKNKIKNLLLNSFILIIFFLLFLIIKY